MGLSKLLEGLAAFGQFGGCVVACCGLIVVGSLAAFVVNQVTSKVTVAQYKGRKTEFEIRTRDPRK